MPASKPSAPVDGARWRGIEDGTSARHRGERQGEASMTARRQGERERGRARGARASQAMITTAVGTSLRYRCVLVWAAARLRLRYATPCIPRLACPRDLRTLTPYGHAGLDYPQRSRRRAHAEYIWSARRTRGTIPARRYTRLARTKLVTTRATQQHTHDSGCTDN